MIEFITCGRADENGEPRTWKIGNREVSKEEAIKYAEENLKRWGIK
jgi:hypothetical protein